MALCLYHRNRARRQNSAQVHFSGLVSLPYNPLKTLFCFTFFPTSLSFFLSAHSLLLISVSPDVSRIKGQQFPNTLQPKGLLSLKICKLNWPSDIFIWTSKIGTKLTSFPAGLHKHTSMPILPISKNDTSLHPVHKLFSPMRDFYHIHSELPLNIPFTRGWVPSSSLSYLSTQHCT